MIKNLHSNFMTSFKKRKEKTREFLFEFRRAYYDVIIFSIRHYKANLMIGLVLKILDMLQIISYCFDEKFLDIWGKDSSLFWLLHKLLSPVHIFLIFKGSTLIYLLVLYLLFLSNLLIYILFFYMSSKAKKGDYSSVTFFKIIFIMLQLSYGGLIIPTISMFFSIFLCENGFNPMGNNLKCWDGPYIFHAIISGISIFSFIVIIFFVGSTFFDCHANNQSAISKKTIFFDNFSFGVKLIVCFGIPLCKDKYYLGLITLLVSIGYFYILYILKTEIVFYCTTMQKSCALINGILFLIFFILYLGHVKEEIKATHLLFMFIVGAILIVIGSIFLPFKLKYYNLIRPLSFTKNGKDIIDIVETLMIIVNGKKNDRKFKLMTVGYISYIIETQDSCRDFYLDKYFENENSKNEGMEFLYMQINTIYKYGLVKFPESIELKIHHIIFLLDKLKRKDEAMLELNKININKLNLPQEFEVYRLKKDIEDLSEANSDVKEGDIFTSMTFKGLKKHFRELIIKVSCLYIEFWSMLSLADKERQDELSILNELGSKINDSVDQIDSIFKKIQNLSPFDMESIAQYIRFNKEILNDTKKVEKYKIQINDHDYETKEEIEESHLNQLDLNALMRNDHEQFILYSGDMRNIGVITHISLSLCGFLGYTRHELIGKQIDTILPEMCAATHQNILKEISRKYNKPYLDSLLSPHKNKIQFQKESIFLRNKARYIFPVKTKTALFPHENGCQYFIMKMNHGFHQNGCNPSNCYVLTNKNFMIQNFSANALNLLHLESYHIGMNSKSITDYIKQFQEALEIQLIGSDNDEENSFLSERTPRWKKGSIKKPDYEKLLNIKRKIAKSHFSSPSPIIWMYKPKGVTRQEDNFVLTIKKYQDFGEHLGYIFKFEAMWHYRMKEKQRKSSISRFSLKSSKLQLSGLKKTILRVTSESSITLKNDFCFDNSFLMKSFSNLGLDALKFDKNYIPEIDKQFIIDANNYSYIQNQQPSQRNKMIGILRERAAKILNKKIESSVYSSSSNSYYDSKSDTSKSNTSKSDTSNISSSKSSNESSALLQSIEEEKISKRNNKISDDNSSYINSYYHVNLKNIKLFEYEFNQKQLILKESQNHVGTMELRMKENYVGTTFKLEHAKTLPTKSLSSNMLTLKKHTEDGRYAKNKNYNNEQDKPKGDSINELIKAEIGKALKSNSSAKVIYILHILAILSVLLIIAKGGIFIFVFLNKIKETEEGIYYIKNSYDVFINIFLSFYYTREVTLLGIDDYLAINKTKEFNINQQIIKELFYQNYKANLDMEISSFTITDEYEQQLNEINEGRTFFLYENMTIGINKEESYRVAISNYIISLMHISNLTIDTIYPTQMDVFVFLYNSNNFLYPLFSLRAKFIKEMFEESYKYHKKIIIIIFIGLELLLLIAYLVLFYGLKEVSTKKNSYLTVFYEIENNVIMKSLSKCESFHMSLIKNGSNGNDQFSIDLQLSKDDFNDDYIQNPFKEKPQTTSYPKKRTQKVNKNFSKDIIKANYYIISFLIILLLFDILIILFFANFYSQSFNSVQIYQSEKLIQLNCLVMVNLIREFMFDSNSYFENQPLVTFLPKYFQIVFPSFQEEKKNINSLIEYLPSYFYNEYYKINFQSICSSASPQINYIKDYYNCSTISDNAADMGLEIVYVKLLEEVRILFGLVHLTMELNSYISNMTYNLTLIGTKEYEKMIPKENYTYALNPINFFNTDTHFRINFILRYIINPAFDELSRKIDIGINNTVKTIVNLILIGFSSEMCLVLLLYFSVFILFIEKLNQSIYKTKNMLSIIPPDVLVSLGNITSLLNIQKKIEHFTNKKFLVRNQNELTH